MPPAATNAPPLFRRGLSPNTLLTVYLALSMALFVLDVKFQALNFVRQSLVFVVEPVQRVMQLPQNLYADAKSYMNAQVALRAENHALKRDNLEKSLALSDFNNVLAENARLRMLLDIKERHALQGKVSTILYSPRDPFSRRVIVNLGAQSEIITGQAALNAQGVLGQITRVFPFASEITLISDKNHMTPVKNKRTGKTMVAYGMGENLLELRFVPPETDIRTGDALVTSGLDDIYPPNFAVARIINVEKQFPFMKIEAAPVAATQRLDEILLIEPKTKRAPPPTELESQILQ